MLDYTAFQLIHDYKNSWYLQILQQEKLEKFPHRTWPEKAVLNTYVSMWGNSHLFLNHLIGKHLRNMSFSAFLIRW